KAAAISSAGRRNPRNRLPTADRHIDIKRVELDDAGDPTGALRGEKRCATAAEWIEDDPVTPTAISAEISDQTNRLNRRMKIKITPTCRMKAIDARVIEHIGAIAPTAAKPEIVDVRPGAAFEDSDELVLRTIEAPLPGIGLVPDKEIFPLGIPR